MSGTVITLLTKLKKILIIFNIKFHYCIKISSPNFMINNINLSFFQKKKNYKEK